MATTTKAKTALGGFLAVGFAQKTGYTGVVGDFVEITADYEVDKPTGVSNKIVGEVAVAASAANNNQVTVNTRFTKLRKVTIGAGSTPVGPFVIDANAKAIAYVPATHADMAVMGILLEGGDLDDVVDALVF